MKKMISLFMCISIMCSMCMVAWATDIPQEPIDMSPNITVQSADNSTYGGTGLLEATQAEMEYWAQKNPQEIMETGIEPQANATWQPWSHSRIISRKSTIHVQSLVRVWR